MKNEGQRGILSILRPGWFVDRQRQCQAGFSGRRKLRQSPRKIESSRWLSQSQSHQDHVCTREPRSLLSLVRHRIAYMCALRRLPDRRRERQGALCQNTFMQARKLEMDDGGRKEAQRKTLGSFRRHHFYWQHHQQPCPGSAKDVIVDVTGQREREKERFPVERERCPRSREGGSHIGNPRGVLEERA